MFLWSSSLPKANHKGNIKWTVKHHLSPASWLCAETLIQASNKRFPPPLPPELGVLYDENSMDSPHEDPVIQKHMACPSHKFIVCVDCILMQCLMLRTSAIVMPGPISGAEVSSTKWPKLLLWQLSTLGSWLYACDHSNGKHVLGNVLKYTTEFKRSNKRKFIGFVCSILTPLVRWYL